MPLIGAEAYTIPRGFSSSFSLALCTESTQRTIETDCSMLRRTLNIVIPRELQSRGICFSQPDLTADSSRLKASRNDKLSKSSTELYTRMTILYCASFPNRVQYLNRTNLDGAVEAIRVRYKSASSRSAYKYNDVQSSLAVPERKQSSES